MDAIPTWALVAVAVAIVGYVVGSLVPRPAWGKTAGRADAQPDQQPQRKRRVVGYFHNIGVIVGKRSETLRLHTDEKIEVDLKSDWISVTGPFGAVTNIRTCHVVVADLNNPVYGE